MEITHCPRCKSDNVAFCSRRKYFFKMAICLLIIILCYGMIYGLTDEDFDRTVIIGVFGSLLLATLSFILAIYYFIKAIRQKQSHYQCRYCKKKFASGLIIAHDSPTGECLLKNIRKHQIHIRDKV